ncbi:MAG: type II toxin-antitoxin system VapB family antitoxin [Acidobacteriia bacterium]|nr:type II toxin-antitoxin system VapB family antitoxin [Terriglobia bacterium]
MALIIKNAAVERLATDVAALAKESKTEAIRRALTERKERLMTPRLTAGKQERLEALLKNCIWPQIPASVRGRRLSGRQREAVLRYGPTGV